MKQRSKFNVFYDYVQFVREQESVYCSDLNDSFALEFIKRIENTSMNKLYKLPILLAFYNDGYIRMTLSEADIISSFKEFYSNGQNALDMLKDKATRNFKDWDDKSFLDLAFRNPIYFLNKTDSNFFELNGKTFSLNNRLKSYIRNQDFIEQFRDVIEYKRLRFLKDNLLKKEEAINKLIEGRI